MEFRQLRYFIAVAEELSFSRGAIKAGVSQPPLSRQIANLEAEIGARLFDRDKHGVKLTEAGRVFYGEALKTLASSERAVHMTQRAAKGQTGSLSLGFGGSAAYTLAPSILRQFRSLHPGVELSLHNLPMTAQMEHLRDETIDIGFVMLPVHDKRFETKLLMRDPLVVAIPTGHELKSRKTIGLRGIESFDIVSFTRTSGLGFYTHVLAICRKAGFVPVITQEAATMEAVIGLVAAGVGVSVVPSIAKRLRISGVDYIAIRESYAVMEFAMAWRADNTSPVVRAFVELVGKSI
jgi:DNA-binding transcriptional LysR family regulator